MADKLGVLNIWWILMFFHNPMAHMFKNDDIKNVESECANTGWFRHIDVPKCWKLMLSKKDSTHKGSKIMNYKHQHLIAKKLVACPKTIPKKWEIDDLKMLIHQRWKMMISKNRNLPAKKHKDQKWFLFCMFFWQVGHKVGRQQSGTVCWSYVINPVLTTRLVQGLRWVFATHERKKAQSWICTGSYNVSVSVKKMGEGGTGGAIDIVKAKRSGEEPRATGDLVSNFPDPRVNKTKQHTHTRIRSQLFGRCSVARFTNESQYQNHSWIRGVPASNHQTKRVQIWSADSSWGIQHIWSLYSRLPSQAPWALIFGFVL